MLSLYSPSRTPPIPIREGSLESTSKAGRRKTATPKAAAIAQEPRMNVDGTTRKNPRKHQTDKPEERKAKRKRKTLEGMGRFALPNPRGNSNARPKSYRHNARSTPVSGQPAERNASFSTPRIPTEVHQPQHRGPYVGQMSRPPVTPTKERADAISISSSPVSPAISTNHTANTSGGADIIVLSPDSSHGTSGVGSDPRSSTECSIRGSESVSRSPSSVSDEGEIFYT